MGEEAVRAQGEIVRLLSETTGVNWWVNQRVPKIPLGVYHVDGKKVVAYMRLPIKDGQVISDTCLIVGATGSGKSVTTKVVLWFTALVRPVIVFDWAGADSYLMRDPNSVTRNLPPHTRATGVKGRYLYYPMSGARPRRDYEKIVRPNLEKYGAAQLQALGFSPGASLYLRNVLRKYGPFRNMRTLHEFIEHFPRDDRASRFTIKALHDGKMKIAHPRWYQAGDVIPQVSKDSLKKILPGLVQKNIFRLDDKEEFDIRTALLRGENVVFSFNDKDVGRVEINYYLRVLQTFRRQHASAPRPAVFLEEAHKVLAQDEKAIDEVIEDFVLVCRKLSIGLVLTMPEVINLSDRVLNDMKNIIVGKFKGENANKIIRAMGYDDRAKVIPYLKFNRYTDDREFIVYNQDYGTVFKFEPFNSPCEIHRETIQAGQTRAQEEL